MWLFIIFINIPYTYMCYLKNIRHSSTNHNQTHNNQSNFPFHHVSFITQNHHENSQYPHFLEFSLPNSNPLQFLSIKLQQNCTLIQTLNHKIQQIFAQKHQLPNQSSNNHHQHQSMPDPLYQTLFSELRPNFGQKPFEFKIVMQNKLPKIFYKNIKYSLHLKLTQNIKHKSSIFSNSKQQKIVGHPINICVGVFDNLGRWITSNFNERELCQGTESQFIRRKADFPKLFFTQINSNLPNSKLNLAIYAKPKLSRQKMEQGDVKWWEVKPLMIRNVKILAKKKKKYHQEAFF